MTHRLLGLAFLRFAVGAVFRLSWFTCCSVFMTPAADVLKRKKRKEVLNEVRQFLNHTIQLVSACHSTAVKAAICKDIFSH